MPARLDGPLPRGALKGQDAMENRGTAGCGVSRARDGGEGGSWCQQHLQPGVWWLWYVLGPQQEGHQPPEVVQSLMAEILPSSPGEGTAGHQDAASRRFLTRSGASLYVGPDEGRCGLGDRAWMLLGCKVHDGCGGIEGATSRVLGRGRGDSLR